MPGASRWKRPARDLIFSVPIAQRKERECPKLQVAGESPAGDTNLRERSSSAEHSRDMRGVKRAALFAPTIFEGITQRARADASHASGRRRESSCPHHFCPCGVVQPTRLPLMQEITGAKPGRDAIFIGAWLTRNSRLTWLSTRKPWTFRSSSADQVTLKE